MDFNDSVEEARYRAHVREWLAKTGSPFEVDGLITPDTAAEYLPTAKAWQRAKASAGFGAITWPRHYGGANGTAIEAVIFRQEESQLRLPRYGFGIGLGMCIPTLMARGTSEQRERFIKPALFGDEIWCQLFSEPAAGSDVAGLRTRAERDASEWRINGEKVWTTGAHFADFGLLIARSNPNLPKHRGMTCFIVDMRAEGLEIRPIRQMSGSSGFNEVHLKDVRISDSMRVDEVGLGWEVALTTLMNERLSIITAEQPKDTGVEGLIALARSVTLESGPAITNAGVRDRIAEFYLQEQGLRYTIYRTLTSLARGQTPGPENSIGKLVSAKRAQDLAAFAMELQELAGITLDSSVAGAHSIFQHAYMSSPGMRIAGGTDEILRNIVAERVLHLPPDSRVDKEVAFKNLPVGR